MVASLLCSPFPYIEECPTWSCWYCLHLFIVTIKQHQLSLIIYIYSIHIYIYILIIYVHYKYYTHIYIIIIYIYIYKIFRFRYHFSHLPFPRSHVVGPVLFQVAPGRRPQRGPGGGPAPGRRQPALRRHGRLVGGTLRGPQTQGHPRLGSWAGIEVAKWVWSTVKYIDVPWFLVELSLTRVFCWP